MVTADAVLINDRYRLAQLLGEGGMGSVYRAYDTLLERDVAIKLLNTGGRDDEAHQRMLREAKSIAKLNHPNIVQVYDAGQLDSAAGLPLASSTQPIPYIVMELVKGEGLQDYTPLGYQQVIDVARQITAALAHAHSHGIVHRDLKPENVLIAANGTAKLMDFGLARSGTSRITAQGQIIGTVFYLPPEVANAQAIDGRADLYSLGVMLYEMVTGELPFIGNDPLALIAQHIHVAPLPPSKMNPALPQAWDDLILDLMAKSPEDRPSSAREVDLRLATMESIVAVWDLRERAKGMDLSAGSRSWLSQLNRHRIANGRVIGQQALRAGVGGATALALFGATRPLQTYLLTPADYQQILEAFVLPAWILISAFATAFFGGFQGLASAYMAGLSDVFATSRRYALSRLLFCGVAGLAHSAYLILFSVLELFIPPLVTPALYIPTYILYGIFLGGALSYVIPVLGAARTTSEQMKAAILVTIVIWIVTIPLIIATYGSIAWMMLPFRLGFVAFLALGVGLALRSREPKGEVAPA